MDSQGALAASEMEVDDAGDLRSTNDVFCLPSPEIVSCETVSLCLDGQFQPEMGALHLDWNGWPGARQHRIWRLPLGSTVTGPVPTRFGLRILRASENRYALHLVWNRTGFAWADLTRDEMTMTSLKKLLEALGTNLDSLFSQPVWNPPGMADTTIRSQ